jgi:hypothetical protein
LDSGYSPSSAEIQTVFLPTQKLKQRRYEKIFSATNISQKPDPIGFQSTSMKEENCSFLMK